MPVATMTVQRSSALCLLWSIWLIALRCAASASNVLDLEPPERSLHSLRGVAWRGAERSTADQMLTLESEAIQEKINKVDAALTKFMHQPGGTIAQQSLSAVAAVPSIMLQNSAEGEDLGRADALRTRAVQEDVILPTVQSAQSQPSLVQSGAKMRSGSRGFFGDLAEWNYVDSHTLPHRNKCVLGVIEMIFPLGWLGIDRLYLGQPLLAGLKGFGMLCTCVAFCIPGMNGALAFCTCGILSVLWGMLDAFIISFNCLIGSKYLFQFGMGAWFGNELEITIAQVIGVLIVMTWVSAYCFISWTIAPYLKVDEMKPYATKAPHHLEDVSRDTFLNAPDPRYLNLAQNPFALDVKRYTQSEVNSKLGYY